MIKRCLFAFLFVVCTASYVYSNALDIPFTYGSRLNAMAGAGSAIADGGTAIAVNPAGLANVENFNFEGALNSMIMTLQTPANGQNTRKTITAYNALGFFGMGVRLSEVVTVGFLLYTPSGGGARQEDVTFGLNVPPNDFGGYLIFLEFGPCIAINLPGGLKIGFVYRINYVESWAKTYFVDGSGMFRTSFGSIWTSDNYYSQMHQSGYGFNGIRVGLQWSPTDSFHFGIAYRSMAKINTKGTMRMNPVGEAYSIELDIEQLQRYASQLKTGFSIFFTPGFLMSFDYTLDFYTEYEKTTLEIVGIGMGTEYRAKNAHAFRLGFEYMITDSVPFRIGYGYSTGYGNRLYHNAASTGAPGPNQFWSIGTGFDINDSWEMSFALAYMYNAGTVRYSDMAAQRGAVAGQYKSKGFYISLGVRYNVE